MSLEPNALELLFRALPSVHPFHSPGSALYEFLKVAARKEVERYYEKDPSGIIDAFPFGEIRLPYFNMGAIDSLNLFDLDELILFSYYYTRRDRYRNVLDIGSNIGLHSIILGKCGYRVKSFEPDPVHFGKLAENLRLNNLGTVELHNSAVSSRSGKMEFVRVLGNTTGSHLAGSKPNPYGELERLMVEVEPIAEHLRWADLVKLDAEGHEKEIIGATNAVDWEGKDAVVEISSGDNSEFVFRFFEGTGVRLFSQKTNWGLVRHMEDMPSSYRDGSLFLSGTSRDMW